MALNYFEVARGLRVGNSVFLSGAVAPGTSGDSTTVGVGSYYLDDVTGKLYTKATAGSGTDKWKAQATEDFVTSVSNALGTKKSVRLATIAALPAYTAAGSGVGKTLTANANAALSVDGIAVVVNNRVLVQSENAGGAHVDHGIYIVTATGSGIAPYILTRALDADENSEMLDGQFVIANEGTQAGYGFVLVTNDTITVDTTALDYSRFGEGEEVSFINAFIGKAAGNDMPNYTSNVYVVDGTSLEAAISALDVQANLSALEILQARTETTAAAVTTIVTLDSVLVDTVAAAKWIIHVQGNAEADAAKKEVIELLAVHNGHNVGAAPDATVTDITQYAKLKIGATLTGLDITVDLDGVGAAQVMRLRVASTLAVAVKATREIIVF